MGGKRNKSADCRFVFATHRDLKELVAAGEFREDLYYRIQVRAVVPEAMDLLMRYAWPSNIRELENAMIAARNIRQPSTASSRAVFVDGRGSGQDVCQVVFLIVYQKRLLAKAGQRHIKLV